MSIWEKYPNFSNDELRTIVAITTKILTESAPSEANIDKDIMEISPISASYEILPFFKEKNLEISRKQLQDILENEELSSEICLKLLGEIKEIPKLAEKISIAYDLRKKKMAVPPEILFAAAFVILAIKIKKIHIGTDKKSFEFYKAGNVVKDFISNLLGGSGG
jgi:hypothetical protein